MTDPELMKHVHTLGEMVNGLLQEAATTEQKAAKLKCPEAQAMRWVARRLTIWGERFAEWLGTIKKEMER